MAGMWVRRVQRETNPHRRLAIWVPAFAGMSGFEGPYPRSSITCRTSGTPSRSRTKSACTASIPIPAA
jgi:hypothetical protein